MDDQKTDRKGNGVSMLLSERWAWLISLLIIVAMVFALHNDRASTAAESAVAYIVIALSAIWLGTILAGKYIRRK